MGKTVLGVTSVCGGIRARVAVAEEVKMRWPPRFRTAQCLFLFMLMFSASVFAADVTEWATAISTQESTGRRVVFRFAKSFRPGFEGASFPNRIILVWKYKSDEGMPAVAERSAMDRMEDALGLQPDIANNSVLALVSTGEGLREWTYYARSESGFLSALNVALAKLPPFPIEIHVTRDAGWSMYQTFRKGVQE